MNALKSVRIRKYEYVETSLDIKVTIFDDNGSKDSYIVQGESLGNVIWSTNYKKDGIYKDFTIDQFIKSFVTTQSKIANRIYEIIQDPWSDEVPEFRDFGKDRYYLNNGTNIQIKWRIDREDEGGTKYSDSKGNEINIDDELIDMVKTVRIVNPGKEIYDLNKDGVIVYSKDSTTYKKFPYNVKDVDIIKEVIGLWNSKVPNYNLALCEKSNVSCKLIDFKDPINLIEDVKPEVVKESIIDKTKLIAILPNEKIIVKNDFSIKITLGEIAKEESKSTDDYIFGDDDGLVDSEYLESNFEGLDEPEFILQEEVADFQEDSDKNYGEVGSPANIQPFSNLDQLLKIAGSCARELGKDRRVNYNNLRSGYIKGIHGLCPQGTFSVLYALTGVKSISNIRGNANSFAINGSNKLSTSHFDSSVRVDKSYINDSSKWQVGDILACDYTKKPYGHIQIWTGYCWMSDFKQNRIQVANVNFNTLALWRLNSNGIMAVSKQKSNIA